MGKEGLIAALLAAIACAGCLDDEVRQPVAYPHSKHVALNMDCAACHTGARDGVHAGIPPTELCATCHRPDRVSPKTPPEMAEYLKDGREIPWVQLHRAPRHVYFSHARHVTVAKVDCAECHGDVKAKDAPFTRAAFESRLAGMQRCVDCHLKEKVTTDCLSCHR